MSLTVSRQLGYYFIAFGVLVEKGVDVGVGHVVHYGDKFVDAVGVHRHPEAQLRLDLVALRHRDIPHVVPEARQPQSAHGGGALRRSLPGGDTCYGGGVRDVSDHGLTRYAQAGLDVAELSITVRGLIEVHEIHVDLGPRKRHVRLGVQMQQRRPQGIQTGDPHLRG